MSPNNLFKNRVTNKLFAYKSNIYTTRFEIYIQHNVILYNTIIKRNTHKENLYLKNTLFYQIKYKT